MNLEDALPHVPGWRPGAAPRRILHSGVHNRAFRIDTPDGRFVVRLQAANAAVLGADHAREVLLHSVAARAGIAPPVVFADPQGRCLVTEYAEGTVWTAAEMRSQASLERLAELLRSLHSLEIPAVAPFRLDELIRQHCRRLAAAFPDERTALERLARDCMTQLEAVGGAKRAPAIVHNDLHHSNIIDGPRLVLVDWEYAGVADPLFDLACLLAYYPEARKMGGMLLECAGLGTSATVAMLRTAAALFRTLSDLWTRVGRLDSES